MDELDLRLEQEVPELEVLPDTYSAAMASAVGTASSWSSLACPVSTYGSASTLSSAG
ncbi:thiocillin family RiPP [Streptomyces sp. NPDC019539]|uniref:thiocillin family RiPP n=1 Tax=Streptomyces sp. NPDC019539 TaxID=3365063 RepID=UPI0037A96325